MATESPFQSSTSIQQQNSRVNKAIKLNRVQQDSILKLSRGIINTHNQNTELFAKMEAIDIAYARYKAKPSAEDGNVSCDIFDKDNVIPPIVVAQVDTAVAYHAEVFLSGVPLFPVVSTPKNRKTAEQLEVLMDDHATIGGYSRQFLLFFRDACKYNYSALHCSWEVIQQFEVLSDFLSETGTGRKVKKNKKLYNAIERLDPYNTVRDPDVAPGDISKKGDYAGWIQNLSYVKMKRLLDQWKNEDTGYNADIILSKNWQNPVGDTGEVAFRNPPTISNYITPRRPGQATNWAAYAVGDDYTKPARRNRGQNFHVFTFYARIIPTDHGFTVPQKGTPQIWKFVVVNNAYIAYAERIISAYDCIPIFFGQPLEDGLGYQTQSIAEGEIPFQEAASTLFNIRFAAARRAVADRALYLPELIAPSDVNSKNPAAKIPVNIPALSQKTLEGAYKQIPFDMRGTETTLSDAAQIVGFSNQLHGTNGPRQGQFQKGNKSVQEWTDTMGSSDGRTRLQAITLENQVFMPLREFMKLNIYQYGENVAVISQKTGETIDVDIDALRKAVLAFRIGDGMTPKSKLASTDAIATGMNMISTSPILQQAYGAMLPNLFAHLMSLQGVRGLEEYTPQQTAQQPQVPNPAAMMQPGLPDPNMQPDGT